MGRPLFGRRMITTDETEVTSRNVLSVLRKALLTHWRNRSEIEYLWNYYKGRQPILSRQKCIRPEINNMIVENRANEIVSFKSGYLMGEPLQYVSRGNAENLADAINQLNEFVFAEEKPAKDKELADWFHVCGTSFRMVLPDEEGEEDESPFEIYTLDPRNTFVVYNSGLGYQKNSGIHIVGYTDQVPLYMDASDLYLTKPGGISITEAASKRLPMVFVKAVAGCEQYNMDFFTDMGAAVFAELPRLLAAKCIRLLHSETDREYMEWALREFQRQDGAKNIFQALNKSSQICEKQR